jgi:nucleoside 2-deoxyribosyltransferase
MNQPPATSDDEGRTAFVILRIGASDVDKLFDEAIAPAAHECGLKARPVAITEGRETITGRILQLIDNSSLVIADLTYERPNCYFEAGYTQGKGIPVIYMAREDHDPRRPGRKAKDPRVHFDLDAHKITYWSEDDLKSARLELTQRIPIAINSFVPGLTDPKVRALQDLVGKTVTVAPSRFNESHVSGTTCDIVEVNDNFIRGRRQASGGYFSVPIQDIRLASDEKKYRPKLILSKFLEDF